jgi:hypothetical protein
MFWLRPRPRYEVDVETEGAEVAGPIAPPLSDEPAWTCERRALGVESVEPVADAPGCVVRARTSTAAKQPAAAKATDRFATAARRRPAATLELSCMPSS